MIGLFFSPAEIREMRSAADLAGMTLEAWCAFAIRLVLKATRVAVSPKES